MLLLKKTIFGTVLTRHISVTVKGLKNEG